MSAVIKVEGLSKQYRLGKIGTGTLSHDINRLWYRIWGKEDPYAKVRLGSGGAFTDPADAYVWALRDVNFEVKQGQVLGIIGRNGAGKSTLLKILSRTTLPTTGSVKIRGRIASLLEVGTGFHPELTGRDNIFLNGAILGMSKKEITRKFDEIVDFSGVEKFIDTPVKRYSSGMYVRLAFAVAAHLEPEILIVDEVLAVGDVEFQKKAINKMQKVSQGEGRTVLFVSHSMPAVKNLCDACIILSRGSIEFMGDTHEAIQKYVGTGATDENEFPAIIDQESIRKRADGLMDDHVPFITVRQISILDQDDVARTSFSSKDVVKIKIDFDINFVAPDFRIIVSIVDDENTSILNSQLSDSPVHEDVIKPGSYSASCYFERDFFATNTYIISLQFVNVRREHYIFNGIAQFRVRYDNPAYIYAPFDKTYFRPNLKWELTKAN
jgi:lipopolysaccharide transport system ATP-binding protein